MRRFPILVLFLAAVSCSGPGEGPVTYERPEDVLSVEADASVPLQYIAFCMDERAAVGRWSDSVSDARAAGSEHEGKHPSHACAVLWRQRP